MAIRARVADSPPGEKGTPEIWFVMFAGPIFWSLHLLVSYPLVEPACALNAPIILHAVTLVTILPVIGAGVLAYRRWRGLSAVNGGSSFHPFVWQSGIALSVLFVYVIAIEGLPVALLSPCWW